MNEQIQSNRPQMRNVFSITALLCALGSSVVAEDAGGKTTPPPFADFTFKRQTVPVGAGKRINVQIDPVEQAKALAPAVPAAVVAPGVAGDVPKPSGYEWFWTTVSPKIDKGGPANLLRAFASLNERKGLATPRLQDLQSIAEAHGTDILMATIGTQVSPAWVLALIAVESGGRIDVESGAGAQGLMQLIPDTATRFGVTDANNPQENIKGGVAYMNWLLNHFSGDPILAMAGYNAGENAVTKNGGVPPYPETRAYIPKVLAAWQVARGLCLTPPQLLTDGCVFAVKGS